MVKAEVNPIVAKAGWFQSLIIKGEAVIIYRNPLITKDMESSGFLCSTFSGCLLKKDEVETGSEFQSHGPGDFSAKFITGLDPITIGHIL